MRVWMEKGAATHKILSPGSSPISPLATDCSPHKIPPTGRRRNTRSDGRGTFSTGWGLGVQGVKMQEGWTSWTELGATRTPKANTNLENEKKKTRSKSRFSRFSDDNRANVKLQILGKWNFLVTKTIDCAPMQLNSQKIIHSLLVALFQPPSELDRINIWGNGLRHRYIKSNWVKYDYHALNLISVGSTSRPQSHWKNWIFHEHFHISLALFWNPVYATVYRNYYLRSLGMVTWLQARSVRPLSGRANKN